MPSQTGWVMLNRLSRLVAITCCHCSRLMRWKAASRVMPALLTRMSTGPSSASTLRDAGLAGLGVGDVPFVDGDAGLALELGRRLVVAGIVGGHLVAHAPAAPARSPRRCRGCRPSPTQLAPYPVCSLIACPWALSAPRAGPLCRRRRSAAPGYVLLSRARRTWRCPCRRRCTRWRGPSWRRACPSRAAGSPARARPKRRSGGRARSPRH